MHIHCRCKRILSLISFLSAFFWRIIWDSDVKVTPNRPFAQL